MPIDQIDIALPQEFRQYYAEDFGIEELALLEDALTKPISNSLRCHPYKDFTPNLRRVPWCRFGYFTDREVTFGADPIWYAGGYYVQEPASMFIAQYFEQYHLAPKRAIDLCAAPGGKSTLLRNLLPEDTTLISNEPDSSRARILSENITRWESNEVIITSALPHKIANTGLRFDFILVDAPCSGEGMFRKEPQALAEWSTENVTLCVKRQREILDAAWEMLEKDGILIYSTCTYNKKENEEQLDYLSRLGEIELLHLTIDPAWGIQSIREGVYRFSPQHTESEGLTIFAIRKKEGSIATAALKKGKIERNTPPLLQELFPDELEALYNHNDLWYYLSPEGQEQLKSLNKVKIISGGLLLGQQKGKDFIPNTNWILSGKLSKKLPYPTYELDREEALKYLMRDTMTLKGELDKGIYLVTYNHLPLGAVKHLGNRTNSLYPKELTIRNRKLQITDIPIWD